jgi:hypothetical protein
MLLYGMVEEQIVDPGVVIIPITIFCASEFLCQREVGREIENKFAKEPRSVGSWPIVNQPTANELRGSRH